MEIIPLSKNMAGKVLQICRKTAVQDGFISAFLLFSRISNGFLFLSNCLKIKWYLCHLVPLVLVWDTSAADEINPV